MILKLRIRDNSIRLRLTRHEVEVLERERIVSSGTQFSGSRELFYEVECKTSCDAPAATFSGNRISVALPIAAVLNWSGSEQVSIRGEQRLDDDQSLHILIEKDFACPQPRQGEDESDMFANPTFSSEPAKCP